MGGIPTNYKEVLTLNGSEKTVKGLMAIGEAPAYQFRQQFLIPCDLVVFGKAAAKRASELVKPECYRKFPNRN